MTHRETEVLGSPLLLPRSIPPGSPIMISFIYQLKKLSRIKILKLRIEQKMNIVLIDNGTDHVSKFQKLFPDHHLLVVPNTLITPSSIDGAHAVILSGGKSFSVQGNESKLKKQMDLIRTATCPLLGVCFGAELIAHSYGGTLLRRAEKITGLTEIYPHVSDKLFEGIKDFRVHSSHRWVISSLREPFDVLARSEYGIEIFKHREKNVYGVQFHPELSLYQSNGAKILQNFLHFID